jgi:S-adenosyl-L-methionine hydrolase (adenosine-forming)
MGLLTLTTDFGLRDEYVGVMKGVAAGIDPGGRIIDITHGIDAQDIVHGAYILAAACDYFPRGAVHLAVVDPGVGSARRIVAVETDHYRFVAPDNGLLERVLGGRAIRTVVAVENPRCFLAPVSRTFHGRDIFMPAAAHLAAGVALTELGPVVEPSSLATGVVPGCRAMLSGGIEGTVIAADRFGNLLTTIDAASIAAYCRSAEDRIVISVGSREIRGLAASYSAVARHQPLAIIGSRGLLELSVNHASASAMLGLNKGDTVCLTLDM